MTPNNQAGWAGGSPRGPAVAEVPRASVPGSPLEQLLFEVKRTIVGQDVLLERMAVGLLAGGHLLVEGVPGLAKTLAVKSLAAALGGTFQRIQFTPDLLPADLVGTRVYRPHSGEFETKLGPVFANLLLADEINRAPAKVQSALLEVMQERQVTIGRETFAVPDPFLVMATQNPIESEGTYPLPEAQVDRFMMKVLVGYPSPVEEHAIVDRALRPPAATQAILAPEDLVRLRAGVQDVYVDPAIVDYAVRVVTATRSPGTVGLGTLDRYVTHGASPRASIALVLGARALALLRGRDYAVPEDLRELAPDVLRHRVSLSYEALADDVAPDTVVAGVLRAVPMPEVPLRDR
ncbi:AAA family ATPase [Parafrankia sp. FMc2]|uniref:AAA family ATPase n=1 Tax=Parafrankia sp. FMc2 TaxID=3233196 RepID=UPI0034D615D1